MSRPRRVIGYARVSSEEQAFGNSLRHQEEAIRAYAKSRGLTVTRMFVEAESAVHEKFERRIQMQSLMADVRTGDMVLCAKLDRWSRDAEFGFGSVKRILAAGASFYAIEDHCDPSTPDGDTALGFRILFAREEHKRIKERTVGTRNLLRARGYYVEGTPPFGYRRGVAAGTDRSTKNILVIEPAEAALVRRMFRLSVSGRSLSYICETLGLGKKRVWSSLHCRTYIGEIRTADGWIKGKHPAIIDSSLYSRAVDLLRARRHGGARPRSAPARTDTWILRDVAHCGSCLGRMGAAYGARDVYYRCLKKCRASYVRVDTCEALFAALVLDRLSDLREEISRGSEPPPPVVSLDDRRAKLQRRRQRHLEAHADDLMTRDELRLALGKIDDELLRIDGEEASRPRRLDAGARREMLRELATLASAWRRAAPALRRQIVNVLASRVDVIAGADPVPTWRPKEAISAENY